MRNHSSLRLNGKKAKVKWLFLLFARRKYVTLKLPNIIFSVRAEDIGKKKKYLSYHLKY